MSSEEQSHFNTILNALPDIMALVDGDVRIVSVNAAWGHFARENRAGQEAIRGKGMDYFKAAGDAGLGTEKSAKDVADGLREVLGGSRETFDIEYPCHAPSRQRWFHLRVSRVPGEDRDYALCLHSDVTDRKVREIEQLRETRKLREESLTDPLTGLRNRRALELIGAQYWAQAQRSGGALGVLFFDLDGFKPINDNFGHQEGDRVLCMVADYLRGTFRDSDVIARVGGDEFVVLAWMKSLEDLERVTGRIRTEFRMETDGGDKYVVSMSIGVAVHDPQKEGDLVSLIESADSRMYHNKKSRKVGRE